MKPIFKEEAEFLKEYGIDIPENCWKHRNLIFLNSTDSFPIMTLSVDELNNNISIKKNNIVKIEGSEMHIRAKYKGKKYEEIWINKSLEQEISEANAELDKLEKQTIDLTVNFLNSHLDYEYLISISGGKDSSVLNYIYKNKIRDKLKKKDSRYISFNTTNDTADTYKQMYKEGVKKSEIVTPLLTVKEKDEEGNIIKTKKHIGWYQWLKNKNYHLPTVMQRSCCSTFKEGQIKQVQDKEKKYVTLLGVRKYESAKRAKYEFNLNESYNLIEGKKNTFPDNWKRIAPICYWTDRQIWLYILKEKIEVNPMYYKGFNRCGCLICPYNSDYDEILVKKYYPSLWERWTNIVRKNYEINNVEARLKWTFDEYISGMWRIPVSKEYKLIQKRKTKDLVRELANLKGISFEMAEKYWDKKCSCGKKLVPYEISMFYKINGRYESKKDDRTVLCKKCMSKQLGITQKEYALKIEEFTSQGCNLF